MSFKKMLKCFYKIITCQCVSCILWDEFGHMKNWSEVDLKNFNNREKELRSK
jgi:hypothetical protein